MTIVDCFSCDNDFRIQSIINTAQSRSSLFQQSRHLVPVNNIENLLHVIGFDVFVLEVEGVLPHVDAEEWGKAGGWFQRVLVGGGAEFEAVVGRVVAEPCPAGALGRRWMLDRGFGMGKVGGKERNSKRSSFSAFRFSVFKFDFQRLPVCEAISSASTGLNRVIRVRAIR